MKSLFKLLTMAFLAMSASCNKSPIEEPPIVPPGVPSMPPPIPEAPVITDSLLKKGLLVYYPFNNGVNDESGNNYHLQLNGAAQTTDRFGISNKAYEFNGSSDLMVIPPLLKADSLRSLTISLWVKATNISRGTVIAFRLPGTMLCSSYMGFDNSGNGFNTHHQMIHNYSANSCTSSMIKDTIPNPQNTWVHMVLVQQYYTQYSVGQYKYLQYINGRQLLGSNTPLRTDAQKTSFASGGTIGANNNSGNYQFNFTMFKGSIDDIRIYERALTEDEIKKLYEIKE